MKKCSDEPDSLGFDILAHSPNDKIHNFPAVISYTVVGEYKDKLESISFENQYYQSFASLLTEIKDLAVHGLRTKNNKFIWKIVETFEDRRAIKC